MTAQIRLSSVYGKLGKENTTYKIRRYFFESKIIFEKLIAGKVVSIGDENSTDGLGPNCEGELCFNGSIITKGYYGDPDSTKAVIDKDGWFHSGDVGYYDEDGYFYIVDRIKELIKYKGYQVAPAELEAILLTHPLIKDAAVVGLPDEDAGELPFAFVVKQPDSKLTSEEVVKYVNGKVIICIYVHKKIIHLQNHKVESYP